MEELMKKLLAIVFGAGLVMSAAPAMAGQWKVDAARCPDLIEDRLDRRESRRDERYDYSRRDVREDRYDRRESRRDERITVCPKRAFYYQPSRGERIHRAPRLKFHYDRRARMSYYPVDGVRIYVR
jgi:hypothetical protein